MAVDTRARIALVVPDVGVIGGVAEAAHAVAVALATIPDVICTTFSLPTSRRAPTSRRLLAPSSWRRGPSHRPIAGDGWTAVELGATLAEFEPLRYGTNGLRRRALADFDLIHVVAGVPAWGNAVVGAGPPVLLHVATTSDAEKAALRERGAASRRAAAHLWAPVLRRLDHRGMAMADHVLVMNLWMLDLARAQRQERDVSLAPPGVDTDVFHPASPGGSPRYLISVARWRDVRKRLDLLIRALATLKGDGFTPPDLLLAGPEAPRDQDFALAETLGVRAQVRYLGTLSRHELARYYREASAYVCSADEEGYGLTIVEAMASGIPVVSTRCGGPEYTVQDGVTGLLVPRGDATAFARAVARIVGDDVLRTRLGAAGRTRAIAEFSETRCGTRLVEIWTRYLDRRRAHPAATR